MLGASSGLRVDQSLWGCAHTPGYSQRLADGGLEVTTLMSYLPLYTSSCRKLCCCMLAEARPIWPAASCSLLT